MLRAILLLLSIAVATSGCCDMGDGARALVDHHLWTVLEGADDPFISRKPMEAPCEPASFGYEEFPPDPSFTVKSQGCAYITVRQPCLAGTCPGEQLHIRLWHFELTGVDSATEAYVALAVGGKTVFEQTVAIPGPSELIRPYIPLDTELAEGTPIEFHLQNHGQNTWNLIEISAGGDPPEE